MGVNRNLAKGPRPALNCLHTTSMTIKPHRALNALLILLLLFAQQAAYAHAISHLAKDTPAQERLVHLKLCDKCASFEKLSGLAPGFSSGLPDPAIFHSRPACEAAGFQPVLIAAYNSRGPPSFL